MSPSAGDLRDAAPGEVRARGEEDELLASAVAGDARAMDGILRRHASLVLGLGLRMLGNRADAEDLLQDVFIKIHRGLADFRGESSLKTWVCQVTVNAARNRVRDRKRRAMVVVASLDAPLDAADPAGATAAELAADPAAGPERLTQGRETRSRVEAALLALPAEYREAVVLRDVEGLSYEEIATALGVELGTVKSRIGRGRARLQEALADLVAPRPRGTS